MSKLDFQRLWDESGQLMYDQLDKTGKREAEKLASVITQSLVEDLARRKEQAREFDWAGGDYRKAPTISPTSVWKDADAPTTTKECEVYGRYAATGLVFIFYHDLGLRLDDLSQELMKHGRSLKCHLEKIERYGAEAGGWLNRFIRHGAGALVEYWFGARPHQLPVGKRDPMALRLEGVGYTAVREVLTKQLVQSGSLGLKSIKQKSPRTANDVVKRGIGLMMLPQVANQFEELSKLESVLRQKVEAAIVDAMAQEMKKVKEELAVISDIWSVDPSGIGFDMRNAIAWFIIIDHKENKRSLRELASEAGISMHYVREFGIEHGHLQKIGRPSKQEN